MSTTDLRSRTRERIEAWNRHDVRAFVAFYAEGATVRDPAYAEPLVGHEAIRKDFEEFVTAFPDATFTLGTVLVDADTIAFEVRASATHRGPLAGPAGLLPPTNRRLDMPIAAFARIDARGRVVDERRYYDVAGLVKQLGPGPA
jgi:steroid delta-isomerase-like uncharacterized protein